MPKRSVYPKIVRSGESCAHHVSITVHCGRLRFSNFIVDWICCVSCCSKPNDCHLQSQYMRRGRRLSSLNIFSLPIRKHGEDDDNMHLRGASIANWFALLLSGMLLSLWVFAESRKKPLLSQWEAQNAHRSSRSPFVPFCSPP